MNEIPKSNYQQEQIFILPVPFPGQEDVVDATMLCVL